MQKPKNDAMIRNKGDYKFYLAQDRLALGIGILSFEEKLRQFFAPNYSWNYQKLLRKVEYYKNCKTGVINRFAYILLKLKYRKYGIKLGIYIPENVFGPGLAIVHTGTIIINPAARVGKNCRINACTNIGASGGSPKAPVIGDNVYIGPGAKIFGDITIPNNCAIAANAAVGKSFYEENIMIGGVPAKKIKEIDIKKIIPQAG